MSVLKILGSLMVCGALVLTSCGNDDGGGDDCFICEEASLGASTEFCDNDQCKDILGEACTESYWTEQGYTCTKQ